MTTPGARPAARMAPGVKRTPSTSSATGASRKKEMMVMQENRLMLSSVPCATKTSSATVSEMHQHVGIETIAGCLCAHLPAIHAISRSRTITESAKQNLGTHPPLRMMLSPPRQCQAAVKRRAPLQTPSRTAIWTADTSMKARAGGRLVLITHIGFDQRCSTLENLHLTLNQTLNP